jgi:hypothetical protein
MDTKRGFETFIIDITPLAKNREKGSIPSTKKDIFEAQKI